jgi:hypothetical protein
MSLPITNPSFTRRVIICISPPLDFWKRAREPEGINLPRRIILPRAVFESKDVARAFFV